VELAAVVSRIITRPWPAIGVLLARHPRRERQVPGQGLIHVVELVGRDQISAPPPSPCMCQHYKSRSRHSGIADIHIRPSRRHPTNEKDTVCMCAASAVPVSVRV